MRIIITVDPEIPVPPTNYGGIERIVDSLVKEYSENGHQVLLLANKNSQCEYAFKIIGWRGETSTQLTDTLMNSIQLLRVVKSFKPDVIHSFSRLLYIYPSLILRKKIKVVQSYQRQISPKSTILAYKIGGKKLRFTACAVHLFKHLNKKKRWNAIYNFTDTDYYIINEQLPRTHFLFLGRIEQIKGTKEAIEACIKANQKLIIAGNISEGHESYFEEFVKPHLANPLIEYVGPVNNEQKRLLLQSAKAMLFPIQWEEPFGIVMAESLSCGTPIVGFKRGSVPEVIIDGVNGFVVSSISSMAEAILKVDSLDFNHIRLDAEKRFSSKVIAKQYLALFETE